MDEIAIIEDDEDDEYETIDAECLLRKHGLHDFSREGFVKWSMSNHPDRGGDLEIYQEVNAALLNYTQQNIIKHYTNAIIKDYYIV